MRLFKRINIPTCLNCFKNVIFMQYSNARKETTIIFTYFIIRLQKLNQIQQYYELKIIMITKVATSINSSQ